MTRFSLIYVILLLVSPSIACSTPAQTKNSSQNEAKQDDQAGIKELGQFKDLSVLECSGIAPSLTFARHYWVHNDSGDAPVAMLIHENGDIKTKYQLAGVANKDFEDCATFRFDGKAYLAIGDIGNNLRSRSELKIYVFREPGQFSTDSEAKLSPIATITFGYEDGVNRDSESLAYLPATKQFILSSKLSTREMLNAKRAELFAIDFEMKNGPQKSTAKRLATIPGGMNTAMDISQDGQFLVIRNYVYGYLFKLKNSTLQLNDKEAKKVTLPVQRQGEAICFSKDGKRLIVTSEGKHQKIFSVGLPK